MPQKYWFSWFFKIKVGPFCRQYRVDAHPTVAPPGRFGLVFPTHQVSPILPGQRDCHPKRAAISPLLFIHFHVDKPPPCKWEKSEWRIWRKGLPQGGRRFKLIFWDSSRIGPVGDWNRALPGAKVPGRQLGVPFSLSEDGLMSGKVAYFPVYIPPGP